MEAAEIVVGFVVSDGKRHLNSDTNSIQKSIVLGVFCYISFFLSNFPSSLF